MTKTKYGLKYSMERALGYTALIAKDDMEVVLDGKILKLDNRVDKKDIVLSDNYFRDYSCLDYPGCAICCNKVGYWNIFTEKQYNILKKENKDDTIKLDGIKKEILINGKKVVVYVEDHSVEVCSHLTEKGCDIHYNNPIHCMLPLIKFKIINSSKWGRRLHITKEIFGRNWQIGCPVTLKEFKFVTEGKFEERCIYPLIKLKEFSKELRVDTNIDFLIDKIKRRYKELVSQSRIDTL